MKQTAVDWLIEQLTPSISLQQKHIDELKEKAKEMEKQQIIDAHNDGHNYYEENGIDAEQYYNQTFKEIEKS
jgi:FtsZ-binding cell division protein ZapB